MITTVVLLLVICVHFICMQDFPIEIDTRKHVNQDTEIEIALMRAEILQLKDVMEMLISRLEQFETYAYSELGECVKDNQRELNVQKGLYIHSSPYTGGFEVSTAGTAGDSVNVVLEKVNVTTGVYPMQYTLNTNEDGYRVTVNGAVNASGNAGLHVAFGDVQTPYFFGDSDTNDLTFMTTENHTQTETHLGAETHAGTESHSGVVTHTGANTFSTGAFTCNSAATFTGTESHSGVVTHTNDNTFSNAYLFVSSISVFSNNEQHNAPVTWINTETHSGVETHSGTETHTGNVNYNTGTVAFSGTTTATGITLNGGNNPIASSFTVSIPVTISGPFSSQVSTSIAVMAMGGAAGARTCTLYFPETQTSCNTSTYMTVTGWPTTYNPIADGTIFPLMSVINGGTIGNSNGCVWIFGTQFRIGLDAFSACTGAFTAVNSCGFRASYISYWC